MINKRVTTVCILLLVVILPGCAKEYNSTKAGTTLQPEIKLKNCIFTEPLSSLKHNIRESMPYRLQWEFSDGSKIRPSETDIIWDIVLDKRAVIVIKVPVPNRRYPFYQLFFLRDRGTRWAIESVVDFPYDPNGLSENKVDITLPMKKFAHSEEEFESHDKVSIFADQNKVIVLGKYKFGKPWQDNNSKSLMLANHKAFLNVTQGKVSLNYKYRDSIIWGCGNISTEEMKRLALSLPNSVFLRNLCQDWPIIQN